MRKESVVFAAGVLRREAHLRPDAKSLWAQKNALIVPFWHKMPLMRQAGGLAFCTTEDPAFDPDKHPCLFLGLSDENAPIFAVDVDDWKGAIPTDEAVMPWSGVPFPVQKSKGRSFMI
ncbi:NUDIX-like domain-containing protein [Celeribacter baekdonensis]